MKTTLACLMLLLSVVPTTAELFEITLINNEIDSYTHIPGGTFPEAGNPWFSDLTGDGIPDITLSDVEITIGDHSGMVSTPEPNMFFGITFTLNGEAGFGTEIDRAVLFNEGFGDDSESATTYRAVTFTPPGEASAVTGIVEITVAPSVNTADSNFRTITFTRLLWDDTTTITTLPAGAPTIYGSTAEIDGASVFTRAGVYQIILIDNVFDLATTPQGTQSEAANPWFSDLTGNGTSDIVLTNARFFDDGSFKSIDFKVNGTTIDTSIEFDFDPNGLIVNNGFIDGSAEESIGHLPITFTLQGDSSPTAGLLETTVSGNPSRKIAFTRILWDTRTALTSPPADIPILYGFTYEISGIPAFAKPPNDWDEDSDGDGTPFREEFGLGTHPFISDPDHPMNPGLISTGASGEISIQFGLNPLAKPYSNWSLKRSSNLKTFSQIYKYRGISGTETIPSDVRSSISTLSIVVTDENPNGDHVFYTVDVEPSQ